MKQKPQRKILLLEDCIEDREIYQRYLNADSEHSYIFLSADTTETAIDFCLTWQPDCILLSNFLSDGNSLNFLKNLKDKTGIFPVIMLAKVGNESVAVQALKKGAQDYLIKPDITQEKLLFAVNNAISEIDQQRQLMERYQQRQVNVVIIEDNIQNHEIYQHYLQQDTQYTYTFLPVQALQEALTLCQTKQADCMLLNHWLPEVDGLKILENLKDKIGQINFPVIMITGQGNETVAIQAMKSGVQEYLAETELTPATLIDAIHTALEKADTQRQLQEQRIALQKLVEQVEERNLTLSRVNQELEQALHTKDEFLATMSHELRTPLNAILGLSEVLQEELYGPLNLKQHKCLGTIRDSGNHLLNLINDILDLTRIGSGQLQLKVKNVSVETICQESLHQIQFSIKNKRLKFSATYDPKVTQLAADDYRLRQILVNLLSNAVKFTPEGNEIGLEVIGDETQKQIYFTVWDTGIGIAQEQIKRLFKPFVQLDSRLSREYEGTGLGLCLVRHLTEMHGGEISVKSELGKGSRFTVSFPWEPSSYQFHFDQPVSVSSTSSPATILLAEDSPASVELIFDYLIAKGYQVFIAHEGSEAIEKTKLLRPDIILMDIQMAGMNGLEATRHIRGDPQLKNIPIIALTALTMPGDKELCLAAGVDEYMSKPVNMKQLVETIEILLKTSIPKCSKYGTKCSI